MGASGAAAAIAISAVVLMGGCYDEPGKLRGRTSVGSASPSASAAVRPRRLTLECGDPFMTANALSAIRARLKPVGVHAQAASIRGSAVIVDVEADLAKAAVEALGGGRLDVRAGEERLARGESLKKARADGGALLLTFTGSANAALARGAKADTGIVVKIDGQEHPGELREDGALAVKMEADPATRLAKALTERALSHDVKVEEKANE